MRNPVIALVEKRRRAQYGRFFVGSTGLVATWMILAILRPLPTATPLLMAWTGLLLVVMPLVASLPTASFFASLYDGRKLDELLITRLSASSVIDGMAWSSLESMLPFAALFLGGALWVGWHAELLALGVGCMLGMTVVMTYGVLFLRRWSWVWQIAVPGVLVTADLLVPVAHLWALLLILGLVGADARRRCIARLNTPPEALPSRSRRTMQRLPVRLRHALMMREAARRSHLTVGGFWGMLLVPIVPLPLLLGTAAFEGPTASPWISLALVALFLVPPLQAAWCSGVALALEKDAQTLEMLHQSPMRAAEFVDGWARVACTGPFIETLLTVPALWIWLGPLAAARLASYVLLLVAVSSYLGVMMSSVAPSRAMARRFLHVWTALYAGFGVGPIAAATLLAGSSSAPLGSGEWVLPAMGVGVLVIFRAWAVTRVQDDPILTGFAP